MTLFQLVESLVQRLSSERNAKLSGGLILGTKTWENGKRENHQYRPGRSSHCAMLVAVAAIYEQNQNIQ
jgi:hypothetical protein